METVRRNFLICTSTETEHLDDAWERECDARSKLMAMRAPHREAVVWKLEELFGAKQLSIEDGYIPIWAVEYTSQFFDDVRHFMAHGRA